MRHIGAIGGALMALVNVVFVLNSTLENKQAVIALALVSLAGGYLFGRLDDSDKAV